MTVMSTTRRAGIDNGGITLTSGVDNGDDHHEESRGRQGWGAPRRVGVDDRDDRFGK